MSVVIRIKRGTESQIRSASLEFWELAFATDTNKLFIQNAADLIWVNPFFPNFLSFKPRPPGITEYQVPYAVNATAATTLALTASRVYWITFVVPRKVNITQLAINVTTASAGTHYVGIYASDYYWQPTGAPLESVSFDTSSTGVKTANVNVTLSIGVYWFAWAAGSAATVTAIALAGCASLGLGNLGTANTTYYYTSGSTLPNPAPTSGYTVATGSAVPAIGVVFSYV
jgi:hypothetical protein